MTGYTKADNWLWDHVMPKSEPNTFKIVSAIVRATTGWHQGEAKLTFDNLQKMTGIVSRGTLKRAIDDALDKGFIARKKVGKSYAYSTKIVPYTSTEIVPQEPEPVPKSYRQQYGNGTGNGTEIVPHHLYKEKERKTNDDRVPVDDSQTGQILSFLVSEVGLTPPHDTDREVWEQWIGDIDILLRVGDDDVGKTRKLILRVKDYMDTADPEPLTYTRPRSFISIARRLKNQPERERVSASEKQARDKADEIYDWLVRQGRDVGRNRFTEWGVPEGVKNILIDELGSDCVYKLTGRNPEDYRQDFIDGYVKHQAATAAQ